MNQNDIFNTDPPQEKERKKSNSVLNKLLNTDRIIKSFSVKREGFNTLALFMEIAKRERKNFDEKDGFSACINRAIQEYVAHHPLPNPQVTLERSFNIDMPVKPAWQCCIENCKCKAKFILTLRDFDGKIEQFQVCGAHKRWRHKRFHFLLAAKEVEAK